ncbi:L,D-transpeptidase family protein [Sphingomonas ginsenosidivorax]|uniref:L,D-transpeptidase family protein n=1 Tax=Sphingomonas ginsenosidivorax TaxID=862135 RepID=A0A5C6UD43_9SPHN|nr:L,D-transpeptidase family protein [Sphingomonas ginsenosidivorax]TXC70574.1 L,D-transpeptidase family protein [Sphingomonas ginsenosidivorax]
MRSIFTKSLALGLLLPACSVQVVPDQSAASNAAASAEAAKWSDRTAAQLRNAIDARATHSLDQVDFGAAANDDAGRTAQALRFAGALARGATDPSKLYEVYSVPRPAPDLKAGLAAALAAGDLTGWLDGLAPQDANYKKLSDAYRALRRDPQAPVAAIASTGEAIEPGAADPRLPAIARELAVLDYLAPDAASGDRYTPAMVAAVRRMQADYAMKPDGIIGGEALAILNMSDVDRSRAIAVAMERLRWLERTPPATRIDVNLAAARLTYWRDGKIADSRKVVVGEPDTETPQLGSPIFRLVANPTWTVPRSIQKKDLASKGAGYLKANNMVWKNGWIVQQPGPKNSLGLVKFDMQNEHAIYLHDTPAKALFAEVQRQRSHGCVRVEDALGFADMLARDGGVYEQWQQARATGKETFVKLPRQIPVRMLYQTVLFDDAGEPIVRNDPYGWDDRVGTALGFKAGKALRVESGAADVGP